MRQIQGHYGGSTGAGATRPAGLPLAADAALVAPAPVLPETNTSTKAGPIQVPDWDLSQTEICTDLGRDCGQRGNHQ